MNKEVNEIFEKLKIEAKKDLKNLRNKQYINENYTVKENKRLKKSLIDLGKALIEFAKNPLNACCHEPLFDIVLIEGKLYEVYSEEKEDFLKMTQEEKQEELNQMDFSILQTLGDEFLWYEEGDTRDNLPYEIFKNSCKVMKKFDPCIV